MIEARRSAKVKEERHDLFNSLLDANEAEEDNAAKLSDDALLGMHVHTMFGCYWLTSGLLQAMSSCSS